MDFFSSLSRTLQAPWSAWRIARPISSNVKNFRDIINNFDKYENKLKIRIVMALLCIDKVKFNEVSSLAKELLEKASDENQFDQIVTVVAGLVHKRLFSASNYSDTLSSQQIEFSATSQLDDVTSQAVENLIKSCENPNDSTFYFQPLEFKYMSSSMVVQSGVDLEAANHNKHFSLITNDRPNFIELHKRRQEKNLLGSDRVSKRPLLGTMKPNALESNSSALSSFHESQKLLRAGSAHESSLVASVLGADAVNKKRSREAIQTLSLDQLKEIQTRDQSMNNTSSDQTVSKQTVGKLELLEETAMKVPNQGAPSSSSLSSDWQNYLVEGILLSDGERQAITCFFADNWTEHFPSETPPMKFKLRTTEEHTDQGARVLATYYLTLNCADHSWKKSRKTKAI